MCLHSGHHNTGSAKGLYRIGCSLITATTESKLLDRAVVGAQGINYRTYCSAKATWVLFGYKNRDAQLPRGDDEAADRFGQPLPVWHRNQKLLLDIDDEKARSVTREKVAVPCRDSVSSGTSMRCLYDSSSS